MPKGKIKWFDETKGYGFIEQEEGEDLFVHQSETGGARLKEGQPVEYELGRGRKGPCATNLRSL